MNDILESTLEKYVHIKFLDISALLLRILMTCIHMYIQS